MTEKIADWERELLACPGPLVWFDADPGAVLKCASCDYLVTTGNVNDDLHTFTPLLREGLAA